MNKPTQKIFHLLLLLAILQIGVAEGVRAVGKTEPIQLTAPTDAILSALPSTAEPDTTARPRFSVRKTTPQSLDDLNPKTMDLRTPDNLTPDTIYDETSGNYIIGTRLGDSYLNAPLILSSEEYQRWTLQRSLERYYRQKNREEFESEGKNKFDFTNMQFDLGPAEKIFGPGGVQIKTQGSAELKIGANMKKTDNPSLATNRRRTFGFDFDEKINLSMKGSVGDKVAMNLNYNTESTFDVDAQALKLKYEGKEDEIIKLVEAGIREEIHAVLIPGLRSGDGGLRSSKELHRTDSPELLQLILVAPVVRARYHKPLQMEEILGHQRTVLLFAPALRLQNPKQHRRFVFE